MTIVTIHHSEKEWESDNLEDSRIDFTVGGKLVGVDRDLMELKHVVGLE